MPERIFQVNAFTTGKPNSGNPAAVCLLSHARDEQWMQRVAFEKGLSETAFVLPLNDGFSLRWFTPVCEVPLCGHATLASSFVLWEENLLNKNDTARFHTKRGILTATLRSDNAIVMDFPAEPVTAVEPPSGLAEALGGAAWSYCGRNSDYYLLEVASAQTVRNVKPDFELMKRATVQGIIITAASHSGEYDCVSRVFVPAEGINEDPVTGSAHCALGPYWAARLDKPSLEAFQASERGGALGVTMHGNRVLIHGRAEIVLREE